VLENKSYTTHMSYSEDDLLPISALQHLLFCERQCALIHLEGAWAENRLTAEGRNMHQRVHEQHGELRDGVWIGRGVRLRSLRLGLIGVSDVVEFHRATADGTTLPNLPGLWLPRPVEYKRGRPKPDDCDRVQLCAQAMCLEEMLGVEIPEGDIFYGTPRRRETVALDGALRATCETTAGRLHDLIANGITPPAVAMPKCKNCSLVGVCMPTVGKGNDVATYMKQVNA